MPPRVRVAIGYSEWGEVEEAPRGRLAVHDVPGRHGRRSLRARAGWNRVALPQRRLVPGADGPAVALDHRVTDDLVRRQGRASGGFRLEHVEHPGHVAAHEVRA